MLLVKFSKIVVQLTAALHVHHKKPKYKGKDCGRQYIENPPKKYISFSIKELIKKLLLERISLRGIARVLNVSTKWLQKFVNNFYSQIAYCIDINTESPIDLIIEIDEMWSFVSSKENVAALRLLEEKFIFG